MPKKNKSKPKPTNNFEIGDHVVLWDSDNNRQITSGTGVVVNNNYRDPDLESKDIDFRLIVVKWPSIPMPLRYKESSLKVLLDPNRLLKQIV